MKFRILEKRGKFRIEKTSVIYDPWGLAYETPSKIDINVEKTGNWFRRETTITETRTFLDCREKTKQVREEFDSYKQAEAYIKKHYGLEGVKAIEEPEWRVV